MEAENKNVVFLAMEVLEQLKEFKLAGTSLRNNQFYLQSICSYYAASGKDMLHFSYRSAPPGSPFGRAVTEGD